MCPHEARGRAGSRRNGAEYARSPYLLLKVSLGRCKHYIGEVHIGTLEVWQDAKHNIERRMWTCFFFGGLQEQAQVHYMATCASPSCKQWKGVYCWHELGPKLEVQPWKLLNSGRTARNLASTSKTWEEGSSFHVHGIRGDCLAYTIHNPQARPPLLHVSNGPYTVRG